MHFSKSACVLLTILHLGTTSNEDTYKAAVVEYSPISNASLTPLETIIANANRYIALIEDVKEGLDIVVFPESTLTASVDQDRNVYVQVATEVPSASANVTPCNTNAYQEYFATLSCAAARLNTYLVVNLMEKSPCTAESTEYCSGDNWNLFNTNVAFDRTGAVVARYRKVHLFGEYAMNVTAVPDITSFETDFGVTFGTFTCFDIIFEEPPFELLRRGVEHFIFPTMWFSQLPYLTALQTQSMWAQGANAVLLAAGANMPFVGSGGSGVYLGKRGPLIMEIISQGGSKVFVQDLPKVLDADAGDISQQFDEDAATIDKLGEEMDSFFLKTDRWITDYSTYLIEEDIDDTFCYEEFCCNFKIDITNANTVTDIYYRYRIIVYSGGRIFSGSVNAPIDVCSIVFCSNSTIESCAIRYPTYSKIEWKTMFASVQISANYTADMQRVQFPNTLLSSVRPMALDNYDFSTFDRGTGTIEQTLKLTKLQTRLMVFGIYGRDFSKDGDL